MGYSIFLIKTWDDARKVAKEFNAAESEDIYSALFDTLYNDSFGSQQLLRKRVGGKGMDEVGEIVGMTPKGPQVMALTKKKAIKVAEYFDVILSFSGKQKRYPVMFAAF